MDGNVIYEVALLQLGASKRWMVLSRDTSAKSLTEARSLFKSYVKNKTTSTDSELRKYLSAPKDAVGNMKYRFRVLSIVSEEFGE